MLNLVYKPSAVENGSLTFNFSYTNNAGTSKTGTITASYMTSKGNLVIATASPGGQIAAVIGASRNVAVGFVTDNGQPATLLSVNLTNLPSGWSPAGAAFTCATVTTGNGCTLNLTYAPTAVATGTLTLNYTYTDGGGSRKSGSINIPYIAGSQNNVVATVSPAGQIVVAPGGTQTVLVNFTTDDANPASALTILQADLGALPADWTGPATFTCATVGTGNGCQLSLAYAPAQLATGTVLLHYSYTDNAGDAKTGMVSVGYSSGTDNTIVGTVAPSGQINTIVGTGNQTVTVTFNSNDGNPGSNLAISAGLNALPTDWSGPATFTCATVSTGNGCQLTLAYNPTVVVNGTVLLNYSYNANSGSAKTGTVSINYIATAQNNLVATVAPSGLINAVVNSDTKPVSVTFTTDDGTPATAITVTGGLGALPAGWTGPATFTCATASTGTGCQLVLTYAPTTNSSGNIALSYSYKDNAGFPKTGTVNIGYASVPGFLYVSDVLGANVLRCQISGANGSLSGCVTAATGFNNPNAIAFSGNWAYVTPGAAATDVDVCAVAADGTLSGCVSAQTFVNPDALTVSGGRLYIADAGFPGALRSCAINNATGALSNCVSNFVGPTNVMSGVAVTATNAYIIDTVGDNLTTCSLNPATGVLSACSQATLANTTPLGGNTPTAAPRGISVYRGNLYIGTGAAPLVLPIAGDGSVTLAYPCSENMQTSCNINLNVVETPVIGFAFNNNYAYVAGFGNSGFGGVAVCSLDVNGLLVNCSVGASPTTPRFYGGLAAH